MTNDIISSFGLKQEDILTCSSSTKAGTLHITIRLTNRGTRCHSCGKYIRNIKDYRTKDITNSVLIYKPCVIHYQARRLVCPDCGSTTFEDNPFSSSYPSISEDTVHNTLRLLKDYNQTFSSVARMVNLSVTKVMEIFDQHVQPQRKRLSSSICIDEFYFSRHARRKYALLILDFTHGNIIDMLESREKHRISSYFHSLPKEERALVNYISIDMNDVYRSILPIYFPNAIICADSFHVLKNISEALDSVRKRVMRRFEMNKKSDEYYLLKYQKHLLFQQVYEENYSEVKRNHHFKYKLTDIQKLEMILATDDELKEAFELKESYRIFNSSNYDEEILKEVLEAITGRFLNSGIPEMESVGSTLLNWKKEILNSFSEDIKWKKIDGSRVQVKYRVSNGPIEGRNKYIKIILKLANGYSNFQRFRNRAMYVLNKFESYSEEIIDIPIKRKLPKKKE